MQSKLPSFLQKSGRDGAMSRASDKLGAKPAGDAPAARGIFHAKAPKLLAGAKPAVKAAARNAAKTAAAPSPRKAGADRDLLASVPQAEARFRIVPLPRLAQGGRWRTEAMRSYSAPVLLWFTRGQGRITVAGVTRGFGPHNAVFLPAGTMHGFEMTGQVFGNAVFFPQGTTLPLPAEPQHLRFREAAEQAELTHMIENLQREIDRNLPVAERAMEHHAGLLSVWLERQMIGLVDREPEENAAKRLSAAYASLVEREYALGRTVAEFAAELGVTPTHLTRSCNAACGRSAHDILADRIYFEARRLLRDTRRPVRQIAAELGFTSPAYFTRAFQKATGETPTGFRKRH